jgi:flagellar protein FlgJ
MIKQSGIADVYTDFRGLADLKGKAHSNSPEAAKQVAQKFESMFLQMALKSARQATIKSDLMNSSQADTYREMYDQQMALELGKRTNLGLSDMLEKQLGGKSGSKAAALGGKNLNDYRKDAGLPMIEGDAAVKLLDEITASQKLTGTARPAPGLASAAAPSKSGGRFASPEAFVQELWPHAQAAGQELGVDPKMLLAQAALESGWGKSMMRDASGNHSHNLFGIKADRRWEGASIAARTLEYESGAPVRKNAAFRAYSSYTESFKDYVNFLKSNPRYEKALANSNRPERFIAGLQKAGYATDPNYARKVMSIYRRHDAFAALPTATGTQVIATSADTTSDGPA